MFACACVSSPTSHSLLGQLFVEIWSKRGGHRRSFLHITKSNVGSAISAQNHLQNTEHQELQYPQVFSASCQFAQVVFRLGPSRLDGKFSSFSLTSQTYSDKRKQVVEHTTVFKWPQETDGSSKSMRSSKN